MYKYFLIEIFYNKNVKFMEVDIFKIFWILIWFIFMLGEGKNFKLYKGVVFFMMSC